SFPWPHRPTGGPQRNLSPRHSAPIRTATDSLSLGIVKLQVNAGNLRRQLRQGISDRLLRRRSPANRSRASPDHRAEIVEEVLAVVRAGGGLGVVLHAEDRQALVPQALEGLIVEVDMAQLDVGWESGGVDREAMILGGDLDLAGRYVPDRMVGAAVAELELEGLATEACPRIWCPRQMPK